MDFEDFTMAEKQTALQQIKKLDEERTKLLEGAKADALARAEEAIPRSASTMSLSSPRERPHANREQLRAKDQRPITTREGRVRSADGRPTPRTIKGLINHNKRSGLLPPMN